jgi:retinol dehydrogenase-12
MPALLATTKLQQDVRVVVTGSDGYRFHASEGIVFKDLRTSQANLTMFGMMGGWLRYFRRDLHPKSNLKTELTFQESKLANLVYTIELAKQYPAITFVSIHPGIVDTELTPALVKSTPMCILRRWVGGGELLTPAQGSWNALWAATAKDIISGQYYEPVGVVGKRTPKTNDEELRAKLWKWTEEQLNAFLASNGKS